MEMVAIWEPEWIVAVVAHYDVAGTEIAAVNYPASRSDMDLCKYRPFSIEMRTHRSPNVLVRCGSANPANATSGSR